MSEKAIQHAIMVALGERDDVRIRRNNTGVDVPRGVRYGLGKGGADLVGLVLVPVYTRERRLVTVGRGLALEVKRPGENADPHQLRWLEAFRRFGGHAAVVTSVTAAVEEVGRAKVWADMEVRT